MDARLGNKRTLGALISLVVIGLVVGAVAGDEGVKRQGQLRKELLSLEAACQVLREENARLAAEVEALGSDPEYMESVTRDELGWIRPQERVVLFRE